MKRAGMWRAGLAALPGPALLAIAVLAGRAGAQERPRVDSMEIASVTFPGAHAFPPRVLAAALVTSPTQCTAVKPLCWLGVGVDRQYVDPIALDQDALRLQILYAGQGYREARVHVDTTREGEMVHVAFNVAEGEPIRVTDIAFSGADSVPREVTRSLPLHVGDPLSRTLYEAARDSMIARLQNRGYAHAEVLASYSAPRDQPHSATVSYDILAGARSRFGTVEVLGAEKVDSTVVRRMLTFTTGDVFSREQLLRSQRNLFAQEVFRHAEIVAVPRTDDDTLIPVRVQVNEGDLHRVRAGMGLSSADYLNTELQWTSRSFYGGARRLTVRATMSNLLAKTLQQFKPFDPINAYYGSLAGSGTADFTQPWLFGPLNTFGAGGFAELQSLPQVFRRYSQGGYLNFSRSLRYGAITLGYRPEHTRLGTQSGDAIFCINFTACGPGDVSALSDYHWLAPITLSLGQDRSNSIFAPTRGYTVRLDGEVASGFTGSDFSYVRGALEVIHYHSFTPGWVWALRIKPGWAHQISNGSQTLGIHPQKRFFEGGPNSVRGYPQYFLGPKLLSADPFKLMVPADSGAGCTAQQVNDGSCDPRAFIAGHPNAFNVRPVGGAASFVANAEVRFPILGDRLRGAAFVDFGQVWQARALINLRSVAWTPGFGVRYFSPIGPVRLDVGFYPGQGETLTVVTTQLCPKSPDPCSALDPNAQYDAADLRDTGKLQALAIPVLWKPRRTFLDRLQLHFAIGQAF